jgi:hypothetical protein
MRDAPTVRTAAKLGDGTGSLMDFVEICGRDRSKTFDADLLGCGRPIVLISELYRCADCDVPFHKACLKKHFADVITQELVDEQYKRDKERAKR